MARKNNRRNRRRAAFYGINPFDYEAREKLANGQPPQPPPPKETPVEDKDKKIVESSPGNTWTEAWTSKITVVQTTSRKA